MSRWVIERTLRASIRRGFCAPGERLAARAALAAVVLDSVPAEAQADVPPLSDARRLLHASGLAPERWR